jgi:hypothetical protein
MLSFTKCKEILNKNGITYTDEEIKTLRSVLYSVAEIEIQQHNKTIKEDKNYEI